MSDPAFSEKCVTQAVERFGAVHGLVNNAGITRPAMRFCQLSRLNLTT